MSPMTQRVLHAGVAAGVNTAGTVAGAAATGGVASGRAATGGVDAGGAEGIDRR